MKRHRIKYIVFIAYLLPNSSFASMAPNNAWETILNKLVISLTGPVTYSLAVLSIFVCGVTMAFADLQEGAKRLVQVACGLSIAMFASQIITNFFGFQGVLL